jgi:membrane-associated phospholipid phosphatase
VLAAAIGRTLWRRGRPGWPGALSAALAMAAVPLLVVPRKALTARPGPLTAETGYYPSGHAATALVAYGGAALLLRAYGTGGTGAGRGPWWRNAVVPAAVVLTLATGTGLVLRGHHWPLDVLGSWCLCGMLLLISSRGTRRSSGRTPTGCSGPS